VRPVHRTCAAAAIVLAALLGLLLLPGLLSWRGWVLGMCAGIAALLLLSRAAASSRVLGPADLVTLVRLLLTCAVGALVLDPVPGGARSAVVASALALVAIVLDGVDGRVARSTGTESELGARFDMETDAFLILLLSIGVAPIVGGWVLLVGLARYLFVAASWVWPWMDRRLPPRYWRKVVAVSAGIVLALVLSGLVPAPVAAGASAAVLLLVVESFGRDVVWLVLHRRDAGAPPARRFRVRSVLLTVGAVALLWAALTVPDSPTAGTGALLRVPVEALVLAALVLIVPRHAVRPVAVAVGVVIGLSAVLRLLDLGFESALDRPFRPTSDWAYAGATRDLLIDAVGTARAWAAIVVAALAALALLVLVPLAAARLATRARARRTPASAVVVGALAIGAVVASAALVAPDDAFTSAAVSSVVRDVSLVSAQTRADSAFADAVSAADSSDGRPLLQALRGKDVLVVFVESYGRVALQTIPQGSEVRAHLDAGTATLAQHGVGARSAFLTSPTFGGTSWLAHATLQSGLWIDSQPRYDALVSSNRATLADDFRREGWRTVSDVPSNEKPWPEGRTFYHYQQLYDAASIGYHGPKFSYAAVPDQFTLDAFRRAELKPGHRPVMAEIDLVSSHSPWTPLPHLLPPASLGDGSVYDGMPEQGPAPDQVWTDPAKVKATYAASVEYSIDSLVSFVVEAHDPNLVMVVLGDHAPASIVSGPGASHDVPVTLLSADPRVLARVAGWGWQRGLDPAPDAPVVPMDSFRDRFVAAFSDLP
jgi:phosphatidylglycerophosphate synthase